MSKLKSLWLILLLLINRPVNSVIVELEVLKHKKTGSLVCAFGDEHRDIPVDAFGYGKTPGTSQKRDILKLITLNRNAHIVAEDIDDIVGVDYTDPDYPYTTDEILSDFKENHCLQPNKEGGIRLAYRGLLISSDQYVDCSLLRGMVPLSASLGNSTYNAEIDRRPFIDNIMKAVKKLGGFSAIAYPIPDTPEDDNPVLATTNKPPKKPVLFSLKPKEARGLLALNYIAKTKIKRKINSDPEYQFIHTFINNNFDLAREHIDQMLIVDDTDAPDPKWQLTNDMNYLVDTHFLQEVVKTRGKRNVFLLGGQWHSRYTCNTLIEQGNYERIALIERSATPEGAIHAIDIKKPFTL